MIRLTRVPKRFLVHVNARLERWLPEKRLFIRSGASKSDSTTRFVRLRPLPQLAALGVLGGMFVWAVAVSAVLFISAISSGSSQQQAKIAEGAFEHRLVSLAQERDSRAREAQTARKRFEVALNQVSDMQSRLLASEERRRELETGIDVIQATLRRTMEERDRARTALSAIEKKTEASAHSPLARAEDLGGTVDMLTAVLNNTATERDEATRDARDARLEADRIAAENRRMEERNDQIFTTLEGAVQISMEPLDKMFRKAGMNPDNIIRQIRRGYSGIGGPLVPVSLSASDAFPSTDESRATGILNQLDRMNMYRIAVDHLPFRIPLTGGYRFTSPFGYRWGRLHAGIDLAGPIGMKIHAPADGTVIEAGYENGYGNMIRLQHDFGVSTVYGHLSRILVKKGQKVSRGDVIGATGDSGRSTGPHLHYEIRVDGNPVNPMTFIKAAKDVF